MIGSHGNDDDHQSNEAWDYFNNLMMDVAYPNGEEDDDDENDNNENEDSVNMFDIIDTSTEEEGDDDNDSSFSDDDENDKAEAEVEEATDAGDYGDDNDEPEQDVGVEEEAGNLVNDSNNNNNNGDLPSLRHKDSILVRSPIKVSRSSVISSTQPPIDFDGDDYFDSSYAWDGIGSGDNDHGAATRDNDDRRRTIRFARDTVFREATGSPSASSSSLSIDFVDMEIFDDESMEGSSFDIFCTDSKKNGSSANSIDNTENESDIDDDNSSIDSTKEQERKILSSMLFAGVGAGVVAFFGWGIQKIMNRTRNSNDVVQPGDAADAAAQEVAAQSVETSITEAAQLGIQHGGEQAISNTAFNASMTASSQNSMSSSLAGGYFQPGTGLSSAQ